MKIRLLSSEEARDLLENINLKIGDWNELADTIPGTSNYFAFTPPQDAAHLYTLTHRLTMSLLDKAWVLVQIDNSTAPLPDELKVFEALASIPSGKWDIGTQRTFLFENCSRGASENCARLAMIVFFAIVFSWHLYITFDGANDGSRIGIQDGIVYFVGNYDYLKSAKEFSGDFEKNPLSLL